VFLVASAVMALATHNSFYFFDLPFIGVSVALGILFGRRLTQFLVGFYFLFFLNLTLRVNMQIEGFFFQVFQGIFTAAFVHYAVAKLFGPLVFGRGFCAYGCWSAAVFDLLPWRRSPGRRRGLGVLRFVHLAAVLGLVIVLMLGFGLRQPLGGLDSVTWFLSGISLYYIVGFALAWVFKDNRAFCKYLCPIAPLMKVPARLSLLRVRLERAQCVDCGQCEKACPMDVPILEGADPVSRVGSTECIQCGTCVSVCPKKALSTSFGFGGTRRKGSPNPDSTLQ
jgi:polyferredoxin